jgi:hypothetical protein
MCSSLGGQKLYYAVSGINYTETSEWSKITKIIKITKIQFSKYEHHVLILVELSFSNFKILIILVILGHSLVSE